MENREEKQHSAAVFGASGGIGGALLNELLACGYRVHAGTRKTQLAPADNLMPFTFDLEDEQSISAACAAMAADPPRLVIVATGILTLPDGTGPEKSFRAIDPSVMARAMAINAIGPALIAKHIMPLLPRKERSVFAALSARVGSIEDNRMGGWHSYRASKSALNMLLMNLAVELARTHKQAVVAGLHPGTVDTRLSGPFQGNVPEGRLFDPGTAARQLLTVLGGLGASDSGGLFAWDGKRIPF